MLGGMETAIPGYQLHPVIGNPADNHRLELAVLLKGPGQASHFGIVVGLPACVLCFDHHDVFRVNEKHVLPHDFARIQLHAH